jgi:molybdenum cofactor cytidylyltransferase
MITAIILAAGKSTRMGSPKMLLPWGDTTIIEHVISVFSNAGIEDILVVTGGAREQVEAVILECKKSYPVRNVHNKDFTNGEMLSSIQCGLQDLGERGVEAAMIGLGDQPQVQAGSVQLLMDAFLKTGSPLVVPSFQMHRGHPWLVVSSLWNELIEMDSTQTPRNFLNAHAKDIYYVNMDTPTILSDLDTPDDYQAAQR